MRYGDNNDVALFLHRKDCFFAPPVFEEPFLITKANFERWNKRSEQVAERRPEKRGEKLEAN